MNNQPLNNNIFDGSSYNHDYGALKLGANAKYLT
jgi:hypothetical protein